MMITATTSLRIYCLWGALGLACALPFSAEAKTLYVNGATGSDGVTYAGNSESTPWRSIGRAAWGSTMRSSPNAAEAARAGDTVIVAQGTYSTAGTNTRYDPSYNPVNSGTAGSPITFQASGTVTLTLSSSRGPVIGSYERDYIIWRGFTINEANAPSSADTGPVTFWFSTGSAIEGSFIDGNGLAADGRADNHTGVRVENCDTITVRNNVIRNVRTSGVNEANGAGIQVYNSMGLLFEHNEIYNSGSGIFLKAIGFSGGTPDRTKFSSMQDVIRFNLVHDVDYGLIHHRHIHTSSTVYVLWYQNLVRNASVGGLVVWGFPGDGPSNGRWVNNTVNGAEWGIYLKASPITDTWNNLLANNLITSSRNDNIINEPSGGEVSFELDRATLARNWHWTFPTLLQTSAGTYTLSQFQSRFSGQETGATSGINPSYVNVSTYDFHLNAGSPALTAGRVVHSIGGSNGATIPVGAYITGNEIIGPTSGSSGSTTSNPAPATVQNVRIVQ